MSFVQYQDEDVPHCIRTLPSLKVDNIELQLLQQTPLYDVQQIRRSHSRGPSTLASATTFFETIDFYGKSQPKPAWAELMIYPELQQDVQGVLCSRAQGSTGPKMWKDSCTTCGLTANQNCPTHQTGLALHTPMLARLPYIQQRMLELSNSICMCCGQLTRKLPDDVINGLLQQSMGLDCRRRLGIMYVYWTIKVLSHRPHRRLVALHQSLQWTKHASSLCEMDGCRRLKFCDLRCSVVYDNVVHTKFETVHCVQHTWGDGAADDGKLSQDKFANWLFSKEVELYRQCPECDTEVPLFIATLSKKTTHESPRFTIPFVGARWVLRFVDTTTAAAVADEDEDEDDNNVEMPLPPPPQPQLLKHCAWSSIYQHVLRAKSSLLHRLAFPLFHIADCFVHVLSVVPYCERLSANVNGRTRDNCLTTAYIGILDGARLLLAIRSSQHCSVCDSDDKQAYVCRRKNDDFAIRHMVCHDCFKNEYSQNNNNNKRAMRMRCPECGKPLIARTDALWSAFRLLERRIYRLSHDEVLHRIPGTWCPSLTKLATTPYEKVRSTTFSNAAPITGQTPARHVTVHAAAVNRNCAITRAAKREADVAPLRILLDGKYGAVRGKLAGCRVDGCARSVATVATHSFVDKIGLPWRLACELSKPTVVTDFNKAWLQQCVRRGRVSSSELPLQTQRRLSDSCFNGVVFCDSPNGAIRVLKRNDDGSGGGGDGDDAAGAHSIALTATMNQRSLDRIAKMLQPGDLVDLQLSNDDLVVLWRNPVLHSAGVFAAKIVIVNVNTIQLPLAMCEFMGADFDGDEVNVRSLLTMESQSEVSQLMTFEQELIGAQDCRPLLVASTDIVQGIAKLTQPSFRMLPQHLYGIINRCMPLLPDNELRQLRRRVVLADNDGYVISPATHLLYYCIFYRHTDDTVKKTDVARCVRCQWPFTSPSTMKMATMGGGGGRNLHILTTQQRRCHRNLHMLTTQHDDVIIKQCRWIRGCVTKKNLNSIVHDIQSIAHPMGNLYAINFLHNIKKVAEQIVHMTGICNTVGDIIPSHELLRRHQAALDEIRCRFRHNPSEHSIVVKQYESQTKQLLQQYIHDSSSNNNNRNGDSVSWHESIQCGAKGSTTQLGNVLLSLGQQQTASSEPTGGRLVGDHFFHTRPSEIEDHGFIANGLAEGLTPEQHALHCQISNRAQIAQCGTTRQAGYIGNSTAAFTNDFQVYCDGTVRDHHGKIMEMLANDDGIDVVTKKSQKLSCHDAMSELVVQTFDRRSATLHHRYVTGPQQVVAYYTSGFTSNASWINVLIEAAKNYVRWLEIMRIYDTEFNGVVALPLDVELVIQQHIAAAVAVACNHTGSDTAAATADDVFSQIMELVLHVAACDNIAEFVALLQWRADRRPPTALQYARRHATVRLVVARNILLAIHILFALAPRRLVTTSPELQNTQIMRSIVCDLILRWNASVIAPGKQPALASGLELIEAYYQASLSSHLFTGLAGMSTTSPVELLSQLQKLISGTLPPRMWKTMVSSSSSSSSPLSRASQQQHIRGGSVSRQLMSSRTRTYDIGRLEMIHDTVRDDDAQSAHLEHVWINHFLDECAERKIVERDRASSRQIQLLPHVIVMAHGNRIANARDHVYHLYHIMAQSAITRTARTPSNIINNNNSIIDISPPSRLERERKRKRKQKRKRRSQQSSDRMIKRQRLQRRLQHKGRTKIPRAKQYKTKWQTHVLYCRWEFNSSNQSDDDDNDNVNADCLQMALMNTMPSKIGQWQPVTVPCVLNNVYYILLFGTERHADVNAIDEQLMQRWMYNVARYAISGQCVRIPTHIASRPWLDCSIDRIREHATDEFGRLCQGASYPICACSDTLNVATYTTNNIFDTVEFLGHVTGQLNTAMFLHEYAKAAAPGINPSHAGLLAACLTIDGQQSQISSFAMRRACARFGVVHRLLFERQTGVLSESVVDPRLNKEDGTTQAASLFTGNLSRTGTGAIRVVM